MDITSVLGEADGLIKDYLVTLGEMRNQLRNLDGIHDRLVTLRESLSFKVPHGLGAHVDVSLKLGFDHKMPMLYQVEHCYDEPNAVNSEKLTVLLDLESYRWAIIAIYRLLPEICDVFKQKCVDLRFDVLTLKSDVSQKLGR